MKNVTKILTALSLGLSFTACGGDDSSDTGNATDMTTMTQPATMGDDDGSGTVTPGDDDDDDGMDTTMGPADDGDDDGGAMVCQHTCAADADCTIGGADIGFTCQGGSCAGEAGDACTENAECVATLSGWVVPCAAAADCPGQVCVDVGGGEGACATEPSDFFMCDSVPGFSELMVDDIDGNAVTVCGNGNAECQDGACFSPCQSDDDCFAGALTCNADGTCGCSSDDQCAAIPMAGLDTCEGGSCIATCAADRDCTNVFDGGTVACG